MPRFSIVATLRVGVALIGIGALVACGGGGGSSTPPPPPVAAPPPPPPPVRTGPEWVPGVFPSAAQFKNQCEDPRIGVDLEGNPYPDEQGSTLEENFWLRSWTHETYLWNDEVADRDPARFDDPLAYFELLKTTAVTPSGAPKDDFHFVQPTEEFLAQRNSAPQASYGASFEILSSFPPRDVRVRFTDPGTPAAEMVDGEEKLGRGLRILEVDGVDLVNGGTTQAELDVINDGLFPRTAGETHSFLVVEPESGERREVTLTAANLTRNAVNRVRIIDDGGDKVGYVLFNTFSPFKSEEEIVAAIEELRAEGVRDLVLDLRYNGGGLLAVASQLGYMVAGPAFTEGQTFERLRFNDDAGNRNPVTGAISDPIPFFDEGLGFSVPEGQPLPTLRLPRVFILSTGSTCSASEAVINGLRGVDFEVVLIGDITCGKPYGFYPTDNCGWTYYTIQFQGVNDKGFGDYADGFVPMNADFPYGEPVPGCQVQDDFSAALGDETEALLAAALHYRRTGSCPAAASSAAQSKASASAMRTAPGASHSGARSALPLTPPRNPFDNERDMRALEQAR